MIRIHVKLYADLRRYRPGIGIGETFACEVPDDTSVADLCGGILGVPPGEVAISLVNGVQRDRRHVLRDGDQVALWSPIAGG